MNGEAAGRVSLIGLRGSGKTSVGEALARLRDCTVVDLDQQLVDLHAKESGQAAGEAGELLQTLGEEAFRQLESRALRQVLARKGDFVLATGGGVVELGGNRRLLNERTTSVWLQVEPSILSARIAADSTLRPSITGGDPSEEIEVLLERRRSLYEATCHFTCDCGMDDISRVAQRVQTLLATRS